MPLKLVPVISSPLFLSLALSFTCSYFSSVFKLKDVALFSTELSRIRLSLWAYQEKYTCKACCFLSCYFGLVRYLLYLCLNQWRPIKDLSSFNKQPGSSDIYESHVLPQDSHTKGKKTNQTKNPKQNQPNKTKPKITVLLNSHTWRLVSFFF